MNRSRQTTFALIIGAIALVAVACSSTDPATPEPTAVPSPSPTSTATATPVPTSTPVVPGPFEINFDLPVCVTNGNGGGGLPGTAPGPTPTSVPSGGRTDAELIAREVSEYLTAAMPVADFVADWTQWFGDEWPAASTPNGEAEALQVFVTRVAQGCSALSEIALIPPEASEHHAQLQDAIVALHAWVETAVQGLECCGESVSEASVTGFNDARQLHDAPMQLAEALMDEYDAAPADSLTVRDDVLGLELNGEPGWIVSANGLSPLLLGPFNENRPSVEGLGPDSWQHGTALRIRRMRNSSPIDVETASSRFSALIGQQGSVLEAVPTTIDDEDGLRHVLDTPVDDWQATVTVVVFGDFTYFLETGCPMEVDGACDAVEAMANSLTFVG